LQVRRDDLRVTLADAGKPQEGGIPDQVACALGRRSLAELLLQIGENVVQRLTTLRLKQTDVAAAPVGGPGGFVVETLKRIEPAWIAWLLS